MSGKRVFRLFPDEGLWNQPQQIEIINCPAGTSTLHFSLEHFPLISCQITLNDDHYINLPLLLSQQMIDFNQNPFKDRWITNVYALDTTGRTIDQCTFIYLQTSREPLAQILILPSVIVSKARITLEQCHLSASNTLIGVAHLNGRTGLSILHSIIALDHRRLFSAIISHVADPKEFEDIRDINSVTVAQYREFLWTTEAERPIFPAKGCRILMWLYFTYMPEFFADQNLDEISSKTGMSFLTAIEAQEDPQLLELVISVANTSRK